MGANVLAIGPRRVIMLDGNPRTRRRLERAGAEVLVYSGTEISVKGGGGPDLPHEADQKRPVTFRNLQSAICELHRAFTHCGLAIEFSTVPMNPMSNSPMQFSNLQIADAQMTALC